MTSSALPSQDYDLRHDAPIERWAQPPRATDRDWTRRARLDIRDPVIDQLPLEVLIDPEPGKDTLVVSFHGAIDRVRYEIPRFERMKSFAELDAHRMFVADPTLNKDQNVRIGWYLGGPDDDATERYSDLIQRVADSLGVRRVILTGASAGGFAALALTPRIPNSLAVVFSPQTNVGRFGDYWTTTLMKWAFPGMTYSELEESAPERVDIATLYRALPGGRAWYIQNTGDDSHIADHRDPLAAEVEERITFIDEFHADGHCPPTVTRTFAWVQHALTHPDEDPRSFAL